MRRAEIDAQNLLMIERQRQLRMAADIVSTAFAAFPEIQRIAVIGSAAKALWKEVPRFREFRRARIEVWHECNDLDLAVWLDSLDRLGEMRRARDLALRDAFEEGTGVSTPGSDVEVFLFESESDCYLGRLCRFNQCPKGRPDCMVPGCGDFPCNKKIRDFTPFPDILEPTRYATLYERGNGRLRSALDLPAAGKENANAE